MNFFQAFATFLLQGCALRVPGCLRRLTFAFGRPDKLGTLDLIVWKLWAPYNFSYEHSLVLFPQGYLFILVLWDLVLLEIYNSHFKNKA